MNPPQEHELYKILFLISTAGKEHKKLDPHHKIAAGLTIQNLQPVIKKDVNEAKERVTIKFGDTFKRLKDRYQIYTATAVNDLKQLLITELGNWATHVPEWWFQKYQQGFFLRLVSAQSNPHFYSCKTVFKNIIEALQNPGFNILSPIILDQQHQLSFISLLCYMDMPPQIIANLVSNEEDEEHQKRAAQEMLSFFPTIRLYSMRHTESHGVHSFISHDIWLQALIEASGPVLSYQSDDAAFIGQKHVAAIEQPIRIFVRALFRTDQQKIIESLSALITAHQNLPRPCQKKIYLEPLKWAKKHFLVALSDDKLKTNQRWYLENVLFDKVDENKAAFVYPENVVNTLLSQIKNDDLWYFQHLSVELPKWMQPIFLYILVKKLLEFPILLHHLVNSLKETDANLTKATLISLAASLDIEKKVKNAWTGAPTAEPKNITPFSELMLTSPENLTTLIDKGYHSLQDSQALSILWVIWLEVQFTQEKMAEAITACHNPKITSWFKQRLTFIANPDSSELIDDFTAAQLLISPAITIAIAANDQETVSKLLQTILPSLPEESAQCIPELIRFCKTFSMAQLLLQLAFPNSTPEERTCRAVIYALQFDRELLIDEYLQNYSEIEREKHCQNKKEFLTPLTYLLLRLAAHIDSTAKFKLSPAYQKLSRSMQTPLGIDAQNQQNQLLKLMATIGSGTGAVIQPLFQNCVMILAAKMKLLPPEQQINFDTNAPNYTYENLLTVILTFADAPDLALGRVLPPILFELFRPLSTAKQYKKFLKFIVTIINAIPHSFNADQDLAESMLEKNTMLIQLLTDFVFYQIHQLKLSHETSIIESIHNNKRRQFFLTAHLARLIYHREHTLVETLQHHFLSELDYNQEFVQSYQKPEEQDLTDFLLTQPLPSRITIGAMQFPITIADPLSVNLAVTLEIPPEDPRHNSPNTRNYMSAKTKKMVDESTNIILNPQQKIPTDLIHLLFARGNTLEIRNALTCIDSNRQTSMKNKALDVALVRLFLPQPAKEKQLTTEIIQMMLEWGVISQWFAEANNELGNELITRKMLIQKIYTDEPRLFGLLCDYLPKPKPSTAVTSRATPASQIEEPTPASQALINLVETELKKYDGPPKKISIHRMVTLVQKHGYTTDHAIQQFISGYLTKQAIEEDQQPVSLSEEKEPKKTTLIGCSYFLAKATIDSEQHFYPIRNLSVNSFLYFNPAEIQEQQNLELFKPIYEKPQIVGSHGSGLKRVAGLSISVNDTKFDVCYELKVHGSTDRILCYMLPSDSKNGPVIYVACYYLQGGFHGRVNPADLKIHAPYPGFCQEKHTPRAQNTPIHRHPSKGFFTETPDKRQRPSEDQNPAATQENAIKLKQLLSLYQLTKESEPPSLEKALRRAASQGSLSHIEQFLSAGAAINAQDDKQRKTALHWAVIKEREAVIKYLLEQGADPDIKDSENKTALDYACGDIKKYFKEKDPLQPTKPSSPR